MPPVGFEPTISAGERPQSYALDRAAPGTGLFIYLFIYGFVDDAFSISDYVTSNSEIISN